MNPLACWIATVLAFIAGAVAWHWACLRPNDQAHEAVYKSQRGTINSLEAVVEAAWERERIAYSMVKTVEGRETAIKAQAKVWKQKLNHIIAFIWGEPMLTRTVGDVCDFIAEMRKELAQERAINRATARMILADKKTIDEQAAKIESLHRDYGVVVEIAREQHDFQAEMLKRGFGLIQSPIGFGIVNIPSGSTVVAHGETPAAALASIKDKPMRATFGLKTSDDYPLKAFGMGCNNIAPNGSLSQMPAAN